MIFPIGDTQVKGGFKPIISYSFLTINILIFGIQMLIPGNLVCEYSAIPQVIINGNNLHTLITSIFLHGGAMHLIGNMLFLWIFADNIEATIGSFKFLLFYLLGGIVATLAHIYLDGGTADISNCCIPCTNTGPNCIGEGVVLCSGYIPSLGASGAISAVMGAYLVMFPKSQIKILVIFLFRNFYISAWVFLAFWFGQQLFSGFSNLSSITGISESGVAWWAHIGGFLVGLIGGLLFKKNVIT